MSVLRPNLAAVPEDVEAGTAADVAEAAALALLLGAVVVMGVEDTLEPVAMDALGAAVAPVEVIADIVEFDVAVVVLVDNAGTEVTIPAPSGLTATTAPPCTPFAGLRLSAAFAAAALYCAWLIFDGLMIPTIPS